MLYHLDTNAISDLMRRDSKVRLRMAASDPADEFRSCIVVRGEILFGIDRLPPGKRQSDFRQQAHHVFSRISCELLRPTADASYSRIKCALEKMGSLLGENDLWISACALDSNATLITHDRGFTQIPGLSVQDWMV